MMCVPKYKIEKGFVIFRALGCGTRTCSFLSLRYAALQTILKVKFLSKNSILISRENCRFFCNKKTRENVVVLDFLAVDNFDFTRKMKSCQKMLGFSLEFLDKNLTFRIV